MPPVRTAPSPSMASSSIKALKTERTHEENQERAYIAASRRSDRSLEARIESARRASEIHKRRTGRSLRVTEQDVVNEEMYEEEDDDLPSQYRRLTAHLHTSNVEFDKRLAAYLTNHVAMRAALGQAVGMPSSQYSNAPSFANISNTQFTQNSMGPPLNTTFSQATLAAMSAPHHRSASFADSKDLQAIKTEDKDRRLSLPSKAQPESKRLKGPHGLKLENLPKMESSSESSGSTPSSNPLRPSEFPPPFLMSSFSGGSNAKMSMPFSTTLPMESQQLLSGAFDLNDPMTSMFMNPSQTSFDEVGKGYDMNNQGMNQTLAPGCLDPTFDTFPTGDDSYADNFTSSFSNAYDDFSQQHTSGQDTPNDGEWQSFINASDWDESLSQQTA